MPSLWRQIRAKVGNFHTVASGLASWRLVLQYFAYSTIICTATVNGNEDREITEI